MRTHSSYWKPNQIEKLIDVTEYQTLKSESGVGMSRYDII